MNGQLRSVIIIGGGLGGLALAQALRDSNISVTVYERDNSASSRRQGYLIGINKEGEEALNKLNMETNPSAAALPHFRSFQLLDENLEKLMQFPFGGVGGGYIADRFTIRDILLKGVNVKYSKRFVKYEEFEDKVVAYFDDGTTAEADILIGADGAKSKIREQRTKFIVHEALPVANIGGYLPSPPTTVIPKIHHHLQSSMIRAMGQEGVSLLGMSYDEENVNHTLWSLTFPVPLEDSFPEEPNQLKEWLVSKAAIVANEVEELVKLTPAENILSFRRVHTCRLLNDKPFGKTTRVILLGDAAHAMTSHAGMGANTAFLDAIDLAKALKSEKWYQALADYEVTLIKRGYKAVEASLANTNRMTTRSSYIGGKVRNFGMWAIGKLIGGESEGRPQPSI